MPPVSTTGNGRARGKTRRPPPRRTARGRRSPWPRRLIGLALVAAIGGVGYLIIREPFGEAVREVTLPLRHEDVIRQQAREKGLDPALIAAIIYEETRFRPRTSSAGAEGLMQIVPETARFIADRSGGTQFELRDLDTPQINIQYGSFYLRYLLQQYGGDEDLAVAAYNGGETNLNDWIAEAGGFESFDVGDDIPFPETREYVENVGERRDEYAKHYRKELGL